MRERIGPRHALYKTKVCRNGKHCTIRDCAFAHCPRELRRSKPYDRPAREEPPRAPRPAILIDGMNLCHSQSGDASARPLVQAIRHYERQGYEVQAVLPEWALRGGKDRKRAVRDADLLERHVRNGSVSLAPAYTDDDQFVLRYARQRHGVRVLSNDHYEEHVRNGLISDAWRRRSVIKYMWLGGEFIPGSD